MRERVFNKIFLLLVFISGSSVIFADWNDILITQDTNISVNDQYVRVFVRRGDHSTTVNVTGGQIGTLFAYNDSIINITGGVFRQEFYGYHPENNDGDNLILAPSTHSVYLYDSSVMNYDGADLHSISCEHQSTLNFFNGTAFLSLSGNSKINITGGEITGIGFSSLTLISGCASRLSISGGTFSGRVSLIDRCVADIYGYGFVYDPEGWVAVDPRSHKEITGGQLQGFWADGTPFSMDFENGFFDDSYSHVVLHEIPEPATLSLFALGAFLAARKRK
jgi:hypothetical protein